MQNNIATVMTLLTPDVVQRLGQVEQNLIVQMLGDKIEASIIAFNVAIIVEQRAAIFLLNAANRVGMGIDNKVFLRVFALIAKGKPAHIAVDQALQEQQASVEMSSEALAEAPDVEPTGESKPSI